MEKEVGGGIGMGNTCKPMAVSLTKSSTIKKIIIIKKRKKINAKVARVYYQELYYKLDNIGETDNFLECRISED